MNAPARSLAFKTWKAAHLRLGPWTRVDFYRWLRVPLQKTYTFPGMSPRVHRG